MDRERIEREAQTVARKAAQDCYQLADVFAAEIAALVAREVERAVRDEREACAKVLDEHGRDRQPQYHDLYMQEVTQCARRGGSHPATVRFAARWLAAAIRARSAQGGR